MAYVMLLLLGATVSTDGSFSFSTGDVSWMTTTVANVATSFLGILKDFWAPILIMIALTAIFGIFMRFFNK